MTRLSALTLLTAFILLATTANADAHVHAAAHRRMVKRYYNPPVQPRGVLGNIFGGDGDGDVTSDDGASQTVTETQPTGTDSTISSDTSLTSTDSSQSSTETSTSTSTRTPPPPTHSTTREPTSTASNVLPSSTTVVVIETSLPTNQAEIDQHREQQSTLSRIPKNVRVSLIVVASVIVGLAIIWTGVRKWKFRSSRSFQDRLAPIDWQPDADKAHGGPPNMAEVNTSDTASVRRNLFSDDAASSLAPPAHDFTAGSANFRSPSPLANQYGRSASPAPYRTASPGPGAALQRYPSNGSGRGGHDAAAYRGY